MDNRGQAYSAFKLLIAAVVAIAILTILTGIIGGIGPIFQSDPESETSNLVKSVVNHYGSVRTTDNVIFTEKSSSISAKVVAGDAGLDTSEICLSLGEIGELDDVRFEIKDVGDYQVIKYTGSSTKQVRVMVACDLSGKDVDDLFESELVGGTDCDSQCEEGRCCGIALVKAK